MITHITMHDSSNSQVTMPVEDFMASMEGMVTNAVKRVAKHLIHPDDMISAKQASEMLDNCSRSKLYRLREKGFIQATGGIKGEPVMYVKKSIDQYLKSKTNKTI